MPKQRITADDLARKLAETFKGGQAASRAQTSAAGDAGTQGGQALVNPMTAAGDLIVGGESGALDRLGIGTEGQILKVVSGVPTWVDP